jgi:hypothetical protein
MTVRTTSAAVQELLKDHYTSGDDLTSRIVVANHLTTKVCTSSSYDEVDLEIIERYLAAHLYGLDVRQHASERADVVQRQFAGQHGLGLNFTQWGQMAKRLAYDGELNALDSGSSMRTVGLDWLGSTPTDDHFGEDFWNGLVEG